MSRKKGFKHSEETKRKISNILKGRHLFPETEFKKGHKSMITKETKIKIGRSLKEWNRTHEPIKGMLGKHHTEETKIKMRNNMLNQIKNGTRKSIFKKGHQINRGQIPWNKGLTKETNEIMKNISNKLKGNNLWDNPNSKRTQFKKGQKHNWNIWCKGLTKETDERLKRHSELMRDFMKKNPVKYWKGRDMSKEHKQKLGISHKGKRCHFWKGGISYEPYGLEFNNQLKNQIRKRDNQICMNCGIHREKLKEALAIHHINYNKKLTIPENCMSLCHNCHSLTNINREYWIKLFHEKLTKLYNYKYSETGEVILNLEGEKCQ